jgi:hypothetical protein
MWRIAVSLATALVLSQALVAAAEQPSPPPSGNASEVVAGEVVMITVDFVLVKDQKGKGVQVFFDKGTQLASTVKVGDQVEARVSSDGRAKSIRVVKGTPGRP